MTVGEAAIRAARDGRIEPAVPLWALAASELIIPAADREFDGPREAFAPMLVHRGDASFVVAFTSPEQSSGFADRMGVAMTLRGSLLFRGLADGIGVVVNPGGTLSAEFPAPAIDALRSDLDGGPVLPRAALLARAGVLPGAVVSWTLAATDLAIPSASDGSEFAPLLWEEGGASLLGVFTDAERAQAVEGAQTIVGMTGADALLRAPRPIGLIVDPGAPWTAIVPVETVALLREELASAP